MDGTAFYVEFLTCLEMERDSTIQGTRTSHANNIRCCGFVANTTPDIRNIGLQSRTSQIA
jgi:hypothetical protein